MKTTNFLIAAVVMLSISSCTKDLDRTPAYSTTADGLYTSETGYKSALAKIYGGLALTGNQGPAGNGDLRGLDEGFSSYLRGYFNLQELPTDEAVVGWNDQTIKDFHEMDWTSSDNFNRTLYSRIFFQITLANAFIFESSDDKLSSRGITGKAGDNVKLFRAEARFMRALSYLHALDLFGSTTFVTEADGIGAFLPRQATRAELFAYVESEGKELETLLADPKTNEYGRVDKAAAWMLLANLYLNAEVYVGTAKYTEAITYASKVINAGYTLQAKYPELFMADNHKSTEVIFPVTFDGTRTQTYGGTTFLTRCGVGGKMNATSLGLNGGWGGYRTTSKLVEKFFKSPGVIDADDKRAMFFTDGQSLEINDIGKFEDGYATTKWKNVTSDNKPGSNLEFADTDFPMFRLAEAYLIYAEAVKRGGSGGTTALALQYLNKVVERAYSGSTSHNYNDYTLDDILNERAREFYWEAKRRTDLVRFGKFTTASYLWPWKGGVAGGTSVASFRNIYPIPAPELNSNPNLKQNPGY